MDPSNLEADIKGMIIEVLHLEDISAAEIGTDEPLFNAGLGLDSIDALELGVAIRKRYGIVLDGVSEEIKAHFSSVRSLARFILAKMEKS
jgi:acyl carrier protein